MRTRVITAVFICTAALSMPAWADEVTLGEPGYGGSGCPGGTAIVILSSDASSVRLMFDGYTVETGGETGKSLDRKTCNVAIPVHVPAGTSVSILAAEFRGYSQLPDGAEAQVRVELFFAGTTGPVSETTLKGPLSGPVVSRAEPAADAVEWSGCGADVNLRINSSVRLTFAQAEHAGIRIFGASLYRLSTRTC